MGVDIVKRDGAALRSITDGSWAGSRVGFRNYSDLQYFNGKLFAVAQEGEISCRANYPADDFDRPGPQLGPLWTTTSSASISGNKCLFGAGGATAEWQQTVFCNKALSISFWVDLNAPPSGSGSIRLDVSRNCEDAYLSVTRYYDATPPPPPTDWVQICVGLSGVVGPVCTTVNNLYPEGVVTATLGDTGWSATYTPDIGGGSASANVAWAAAVWNGYPWWDVFEWTGTGLTFMDDVAIT